MRVVIGTFWSVVFALTGREAGTAAAHYFLPATPNGLWPLVGLVGGLILFNWFQVRDWLPGLRADRSSGRGARVIATAFWFLLFVTAGTMTGYAVAHKWYPEMLTGKDRGDLPAVGLIIGVGLFFFLKNRVILIGGASRDAMRWGVMQAIWLLLGFILMQGIGVLGCTVAVELVAWFAHTAAAPSNLIADTIAGYLTATLWSVWYIGRQGSCKLHDGSPAGIAWRPAINQAYVTALLFAGVIIMAMIIIIHFFPPNLANLKNLPSAKLFQGSGVAIALMMILAVFVAPPVEEYVFRGGIFSALASRVSPLWAGIITTLLFMAVHAPEKYAYPPGFVGVGLMAAAAAWMRVKFSSIKPGILLHFVYNAGLILVSGFSG